MKVTALTTVARSPVHLLTRFLLANYHQARLLRN